MSLDVTNYDTAVRPLETITSAYKVMQACMYPKTLYKEPVQPKISIPTPPPHLPRSTLSELLDPPVRAHRCTAAHAASTCNVRHKGIFYALLPV